MKNSERDYTIHADLFDRNMVRKMIETESPLSYMYEKIQQPFRNLAEDIFVACFRYNPRIKEDRLISKTFLHNKSIIHKLIMTNEFRELHNQTKNNEVMSANIAASFLNSIYQNNKKKLNETQSMQDTIQKQQKLIKNLDKKIIDLEIDAAKRQLSPNDPLFQAIKNLQKQKAGAESKLDDSAKIMAQIMIPLQDINQIKRCLVDVKLDLETQEQVNLLFSDKEERFGNQPGVHSSVDPTKKLALSRLLYTKKNVRDIFRLLGKFSRVAMSKFKSKVKHETGETTSVYQSNKLDKLIPSEYIKLLEPNLEMLFFKDFTEQQLWCYESKLKDKTGHGPLVIGVDSSGSMRGNRDTYSKAIALAMIALARKQKRDLHIIVFDAAIKAEFTFLYKKNKNISFENMLKFAEISPTGGTSFTATINQAMKIINKEKKFKRSDILMITDGDGSLWDSDEIIKFKKAKNVHISTLLIQSSSMNRLKSISDTFDTISYIDESIADVVIKRLL
jgi:uncharacterized protein YegL